MWELYQNFCFKMLPTPRGRFFKMSLELLNLYSPLNKKKKDQFKYVSSHFTNANDKICSIYPQWQPFLITFPMKHANGEEFNCQGWWMWMPGQRIQFQVHMAVKKSHLAQNFHESVREWERLILLSTVTQATQAEMHETITQSPATVILRT